MSGTPAHLICPGMPGIVGMGGPAPYVGQIATRGFIPTNFSTTNKQLQTRSRHLCQTSVSSLQIVVPNFYVNTSTGAESSPGATATVAASVEYPTGVFTQIKFSGSASGTVPDGGTLLSDAVNVSIPRGAWFWIRLYVVTTAGIVFTTLIVDDGNGEAMNYAASGLSDTTMGGTVTAKDSSNCFYPVAIIGLTRRKSVAIIGDSRSVGVKDTYSDTSGDKGELTRSIGPMFAYANLGVTGDRATWWAASHTNRLPLALYCSRVVIELGINDLANSRTASQLAADIQTIVGLLPGKKIIVSTLPPVTTSTDSWATLVNQTVASWNTERAGYNDSVRAGVSGAYDFLEIADQVESARNSGKWIVSGANNYATSDGVHESNAAAIIIASSGAINASKFR